ncbi:cuticle protein 7-like [Scylla paramamosain]
MKLLVLLAAAAVCAGAPQMLQPLPYIPSPAIVYSSSFTPAVTKIQKPGVQLHFPANVRFVAPAPVAQPVVQAVPHPVQYQAPAVAVAPAPVVVAAAPEPLNAPEPPMPSVGVPFVGGQFHAQDELKQYSFGHFGGPNTRVETRDALGRTKGSFAYVNPKGDVDVRKYAAAPGMGFKVAASDLPDDTPEVASLKAAHEKSFRTIKEMITGARA